MASQVIGQILEQRYALEIISSTVIDDEKISLLIETNHETYEMIISLEYTLSRQRELETITDDQELLSEKLELLKESFNSIHIKIGEEDHTLWDLGTIANAFTSDLIQNHRPSLENIEAVRRCIEMLTEFCSSFPDLIPFSDHGNPPELTPKIKLKSFLSNTTFGTIDMMRVELETVYNAVQIFLEADDGKKIDCMWIPGKSELNIEGREDQMLPTILYCSPNAFLYEAFHTENEWLEFYINSGVNMFVWNYRGYGRSEGSPNPSKMFEDGEMIIDYLRNQRQIRKIGVHGQSLGGSVACHLARNCNIDFVFIDRSFSSIDKVAEISYGNIASTALKFLTLYKWDFSASNNYILSNTYKVIGKLLFPLLIYSR